MSKIIRAPRVAQRQMVCAAKTGSAHLSAIYAYHPVVMVGCFTPGGDGGAIAHARTSIDPSFQHQS